MGMDLCWVAVSDSREKLEKLDNYINKCVDRGYNDEGYVEHRMLGYQQHLYKVREVYVLCGCWRKCYGYDLGYWMKTEGQEGLMDGVLFFEERQDDSYIRIYKPDPTSEEGVMGMTDIVGDCYDDEPSDDILQSYTDIWPIICAHMCGKELPLDATPLK